MTRPPPTLALALAASLAASLAIWLGLTFLRSPAPSVVSTDEATSPADGTSEVDLVHTSADSGRSAQDPVTAPALDTPDTASPPEHLVSPPAPTTTVWGVVRERESGTGIPDCAVTVSGVPRATTDAAGRFEVELDGLAEGSADLRVVRVERAGQGVLFYGTVRVRPGMEILVEPVVILRGRVVDTQGQPLRTAGVAAYLEPDRLREVEWFLGSTNEASERGHFELAIRAPLPPPSRVKLQVTLGRALFPVTSSWIELVSEEGATLIVDACTFQLALTESDGTTPVVGAELRLAAWLGDEVEPSCRAFPLLETAEPLELTLPRTATSIEVAVGAPGFAPHVEQRGSTPCGETWTLALHRLGPDDVLDGRVLDVAGRPVNEAWVTCNPVTRDSEVGVAAHAGARTDPEGRFSLPFARGQVAELRAYHRDRGMTPDLKVVGGRRDLVLRFLPVQDVKVLARLPVEAGLAQTGHVLEWVLALQDGQVLSGSERASPFVLEELSPGDHQLFVVAAGGAFFDHAIVSVFPGVDPSVELDLQRARRARGRVLHVDGSSAPELQVQVVDPSWPQLLVERWGTVTTAADGAFELFVGLAVEPTLSVSQGGLELMRTSVRSDTAVEFRLP